MGFYNLIGLSALGLVPIIIILYMLRPKNKPETISSLYLWQSVISEIESATKFQKFKSSLLMFLQILVVILVTLMLAGLFINNADSPESVVIVMDCSVSMQSVDVEPSRFEYAKEQAIEYVRQLDQETIITLISLKDIPEILLASEDDAKKVITVIKELQTVDTYCDIELAVDTAVSARQEEGTEIVYFGDKEFPGAQNIEVIGSNDNVGIYQMAYTVYDSSNTLSVLVEVTNQSDRAITVPISLYADDILADAKQVEVESHSSIKLFFNQLPTDISVIKASVDREDILAADNVAYVSVEQTDVKKVVLVTAGNMFLEKILKLNENIELFMAKPESIDTLNGFDLYIYDSFMPSKLPEDGSIMLFNPEDNSYFSSIGYIERPEFYTSGHDIMKHIEHSEFNIGISKVYEVPIWGESIFSTEYGALAFTGDFEGKPIVVYGFDIHNTDLPLCVEFPILMVNTLEYLIPNSMLNQTSINAGEPIDVRIPPDTESAYIIAPDGRQDYLDITQPQTLYRDTIMTGVYRLVRETDKDKKEELFTVNVPSPLAPEKYASSGEAGQSSFKANKKGLYRLLGIIALVIMLVEWWLYNYRRKVNEIKL